MERGEKQPIINQSFLGSNADRINYRSVNRKGHEQVRTVDDVLNFIGFGPFQLIAFFLGGVTYMSYALDDATFTFVNIKLTGLWNLTEFQFSILPAVTGVPNVIGALFFSYLGDVYGRVWPYALCIAVIGVFALASAFATSFLIFFVLRMIASIGVGGITSVLLPMLVEFMPVKSRGKVLVCVSLVQAVGYSAASGLAWWLIPTYEKNGWRYFIIAAAVPSLVTAGFRLMFYFQSPRFHVAKQQYAQAWRTLSIMSEMNGKDLNTFMQPEELRYSLEHKQVEKKTILLKKSLTIFTLQYLRRTVCLSIMYMISSNAANVATTFLPAVLQDMGASPYFTPFVGYLAQIPGLMLMAIIIDWPEFGRLNSLRLYTLLTAVFFLLFAFVRTAVTIPLFVVLIYFFMQSLIPVLNTYISESYPTEIRAMAFGFIGLGNQFAGIGLPFLGGYLADLAKKSPWLYSSVWSGMYFVQLVTSLILNQETRGRKLTDIVTTTQA